ncbi:hypothetical protein DVH24_033769 [Malus domestica]|uniref:Signal recognition particle subunit SRP72 n=1 Tax=Malus domestica TaxID=3750 RepID=A0A498HSV8_MALDO|nr:hypothetical protein DVH24_033769 [Malus domestica]
MPPKGKDRQRAAASTQQPPPSLEELFGSLSKHIEESEFEKAVKVADQVLSINRGDEDALRCKVVALIKADDIDNALSTIRSSKSPPPDFSFFEAYCLYRNNKIDEALELLKRQERNSATMILESQILFRSGKMDACIDIYQNLPKPKVESLEINSAASLVAAGRASEVKRTLEALGVKATNSFELAFNTACSLIELEKYTEAEQLLLKARRIGQEALFSDNVPEDEIQIELAPIAVQLAYVQQKQEAVEAYTDIIKQDMADEVSLSVAVNNLIALRGPRDVSDGLKKLDRLKDKEKQNFHLAPGLENKLSPKQKESIYVNRVLLLLHANKMDQSKAKAKRKRKRKPKYPKGFDPANPGPPPDPERWLPKRERSSYRPKRKDKRAAQVRGSQGSVARDKHETGAASNTSNTKSNQATTSKGAPQNAVAEASKPSSSKSRKKSRN